MNQLITLTPETQRANQTVVNEIFRLRHRSFLERLGWEVTSTEQMECDDFDRSGASYVALKGQNNDVVGCWRALPTQGRYMLKDVFPQLLQGEPAPMEDDIWEISRFTTAKESYREASAGWFGTNALTLIHSFYDFAQENNIRAYVLVTTVGCERMLRSLGLTMRRMGDGKSLQVGKERSVALWLEVDESLNLQGRKLDS
ncbi:acyl-homoserine-lactone synthase [Enterovibrio paralichthyis]|uniref:acyl-homoserine-lactone synthase n=1 Tax=Enterovibrio paralichthyis TaxID=2853805 RepID=UPI001C459AB4|nr:acyl-homoserine-lactone synthase [Enterovibrio paralichthyis]MBV7298352.1 GNAT family N-acetyltransferase [Enterovibrio paralichthyis]